MDMSFKTRRQLVKYRPILEIPSQIKRQFRQLFRAKDAIVLFVKSLTIAQRCYFSATLLALLFIFNDIDITQSTLAILVTFVVVGLAVEFWPKFLHVWESILGKTVILVFYGIMANFALASSAGLVNEVTGVSASTMPYSHNMALILYIPSWFIVTTVLMLLAIQAFVPLYLTLLLILKPFGVHGLWHKPHYRFVFSTALIRYVWCTVLLLFIMFTGAQAGVINKSTPIIGSVVEGFIEGHEDITLASSGSTNQDKAPSSTTAETQVETATEMAPNPQTGSDSKVEPEAKVKAGVATELLSGSINNSLQQKKMTEEQALILQKQLKKADEIATPLIEVVPDAEDEELINKLVASSKRYELYLKQTLADFIYYYEADTYSRCRHPENTRVVELNDYEVLVLKQSEQSETGYEFSIIACRSPGINPL